jgi:hypothetical protein
MGAATGAGAKGTALGAGTVMMGAAVAGAPDGAGGNGAVLHAASKSATAPSETGKVLGKGGMGNNMWLLMIEALIALFLLVFIVWWTMYSGRKPDHTGQPLPGQKDAPGASASTDRTE